MTILSHWITLHWNPGQVSLPDWLPYNWPYKREHVDMMIMRPLPLTQQLRMLLHAVARCSSQLGPRNFVIETGKSVLRKLWMFTPLAPKACQLRHATSRSRLFQPKKYSETRDKWLYGVQAQVPLLFRSWRQKFWPNKQLLHERVTMPVIFSMVLDRT